ncbi:hypothetical protein CLV51_107223 [Chitinophaga niastensis]|uniref:Uncharacterized protein n=1 Tax=Chitinophaga niastensis TaxID=536980 RepID=A0A2P8HCS2_CHINA|nr:hypothetical protein [Chitinophaga niastensis]PSL43911.1 hypothetical protein CLV51_107223 [Chitinophaga niastensis]
MKKVHYISGILLIVFIAMHLFNHLMSLFGPGEHIYVMDRLRLIYRNVLVETLLMAACAVQIISGIQLIRNRKRQSHSAFDKLQVLTGCYLAGFLVIHLSAVFGGRLVLHLDTNFYFGAAGLNAFPANLFFIPYYSFAVLAVFGHLACVHQKKMRIALFGVSPQRQSLIMVIIGVIITGSILYGLTDGFKGQEIPKAYHILMGK